MRSRADGRVPLRRLLDRRIVEVLFASTGATLDGALALVDADGTVLAGGYRPPVAARSRIRTALAEPAGDDPVGVTSGASLHPLRVDGDAYGGLLVGGPVAGPVVDLLHRSLSALLAQALEIRVLGQETLDRYRELNLLYRVGETIGASLDTGEIPRLLLSEASHAIPSDAACVLMGPDRVIAAATGASRAVDSVVAASRALVDAVMADGQPALVSPVPDARSLGSLLVVPIRGRDERIGVVVMARREGAATLTASDEKLLLAVAGEAGVAHDRARLHEQELGRQRLDQELAVGRRIQRSLLPTMTPRVAGWEFAAVYEAAREVGGDFYDFLHPRSAEGSIDLVIGDVTGKGVPAALMMAFTRAVIRASVDATTLPSEVLRRTNHHLIHGGHAGLFVTGLYASVDLDGGDIVLANGGHDAPVLIHGSSRRTRLVTSRSAILGLFRELDIEDRRIHLDRGDALILYTDGVTEARDAKARLFGERRLRAVASASAAGSATSIAAAIMGAVREFGRGLPMADDLTLVVIKRLDA